MDVIIEYKGTMYEFHKPRQLSEQMFQDRCWFIVKNYGKHGVEVYADMWIAWKYFDVEYSKEYMNIIREYEGNMADKS